MDTVPSQDDDMVGVLVDACGWVSLIEAGLNLDLALESVVGEAELMVTDSVMTELQTLEEDRGGLLLDLLVVRSKVVGNSPGHTDDLLFSLSIDNSWPVLTVDRRLKRRLVESGSSYIEVTAGPSLRLITP